MAPPPPVQNKTISEAYLIKNIKIVKIVAACSVEYGRQSLVLAIGKTVHQQIVETNM